MARVGWLSLDSCLLGHGLVAVRGRRLSTDSCFLWGDYFGAEPLRCLSRAAARPEDAPMFTVLLEFVKNSLMLESGLL
jgi:hypothetical protein